MVKDYKLNFIEQVFFRAGVLGLMEEIREEKIAEILSWLQSFIRGHMARLTYKKLQSQKVDIYSKNVYSMFCSLMFKTNNFSAMN